MKHIIKNPEPSSFYTWKASNRSANWNEFSGTEPYNELRSCLVEEQQHLCCYCEVALMNDGNISAHVEHFKPKGRHQTEMFNILNLFACCEHTDSCGHKKGNEYFAGLVCPLEENCESRFTYTGNGTIIPSNENDESADRTIQLLNLNCKRLKDQRKSIIKALEHDEITIDYLKQSLDNYLEWYNGFFTVIQYVAGKRCLYWNI